MAMNMAEKMGVILASKCELHIPDIRAKRCFRMTPSQDEDANHLDDMKHPYTPPAV